MTSKSTTEYKQDTKKKDDEFDLLRGRMAYSILDVIEHMIACGMSEEEIMKYVYPYLNP